MNLEAMRQLTQNMQQTNDSKIVDETDAEEEAEKLFNLAVACEDEDPQKAFELFKKAAELGNVEAMFATGIRYYRGEGYDAIFCVVQESRRKRTSQRNELGRRILS